MKSLLIILALLCSSNLFSSAFIIYNDQTSIYCREYLDDGTFSDAKIVAEPGSTPKTLAIFDADNDSFQDFISQNGKGVLSLYLNDGSNNFTESLLEETGMKYTSDAASGDFDNDGWDDFIISDRKNKKIILYKNNHDLSFDKLDIDAAWFTGRLSYDAISGMDAADINGDGNLDFMVLGYYSDSRVINIAYLYLGAGDGTFAWSEALENKNKDGTYGLAVGDFDCDGNQDVIVGQDDGGDPGQTWLWTGNGLGAFGLAGEAYDISEAESGYDRPGMGYFDAYDFNGDGVMDIISAARGIGLFYFQGKGDGTFEEPSQIDDKTKIYGCTTFNAFSNTIPQRNIGENPIFVYMENLQIYLHSVDNDGTISAKFFIDKLEDHGDGITVADYNNDGLWDFSIFTHIGDLYCYTRKEGNKFTRTLIEATGIEQDVSSSDNACGDFDEDGNIDILVPNHIDKKIYLYMNDGFANFPTKIELEAPWITIKGWSDGTGGVDVSDVNNDGHLDFMIIDYVESAGTNDIYLYVGSGDGSFTHSKVITNANSNGTLGLAIADFNEDGYQDVVVGQDDGGDTGQAWLFTGDGTGNFGERTEAYDISPEVENGENNRGSGHFDAYDFDNDGHFDIISTAAAKGIYLVKGNGDGTFNSPVQIRSTNAKFMWGMGAPSITSQLIVYDLGFRPIPDGYSFNNKATTRDSGMYKQFYGEEIFNHPDYKDDYFRTYKQGHMQGSCAGFASTALINYMKLDQPNAGPYAVRQIESPFEIILMGPALENAIAYYHGYINSQHISSVKVSENLPVFVDTIKDAFNSKRGLILGIAGQVYNDSTNQWEKNKGHIIVPYRLVELSDYFDLYLYDSNFPAIEKKLKISILENKWFYIVNEAIRYSSSHVDDNIGLYLYPIELFLQKGVPGWITTEVFKDSYTIPLSLLLYPNYPNPFNAQTTIRYDIPERSTVTMSVYDVLGRRVRVLVNRQVEPGCYSETWNGKNALGKDAPTGMYIVTLSARGESIAETKTIKMVLLR